MADQICPGACNNTYRRRRALYEADMARYARTLETRADDDPIPECPRPPDITPWYGFPVWCLKCQSSLRGKLAELDDLAALLAAVPGLNAPADSAGKVSGTRGKRSPSPFGDDLLELEDWLRDWESASREADPGARRGYLASAITTITAQLVQHFDRIISHPDMAQDFGTEIGQWHRTLAAKAHAGQALKHQKQRCPRCKDYTLWRADGESYVKCVNVDCQRLLSLDEYDRLADSAA